MNKFDFAPVKFTRIIFNEKKARTTKQEIDAARAAANQKTKKKE